MLHNIKKEIFLSLLTSLIVGVITFSLLHLGMEQSIGLSFISGLLFFLFLHSSEEDSSNEEKKPLIDNNEEYRLLEKKFKAISEKADKLELEKKTTEYFLASMPHEIRTPLNGIIGLTEVLDDTSLTKEQKETARKLNKMLDKYDKEQESNLHFGNEED